MNHPGFRDSSVPASVNWQGEPERPEWPLYLDYMEIHLRELLTRYGDVFVIWFDGLGNQRQYDGLRFHRLIRELQPPALINNRIGLPGDFMTPEQRLPKGIPVKGSQVGATSPADEGLSSGAPAPQDFQPWETCMTINTTWAYNKNDTQYKSTTELIRHLIDAASKGGNFLLNVGPTPEGLIQPEFEERLRGVGAWLERNGEAIYGATYGPLQNLDFGRTTAKGKTVYLHVFDLPAAALEIRGLRSKVRGVRLLDGNKPLRHAQNGDRLAIHLDGVSPDRHATVFAIETR
jgi:alpha-L-fucosidase